MLLLLGAARALPETVTAAVGAATLDDVNRLPHARGTAIAVGPVERGQVTVEQFGPVHASTSYCSARQSVRRLTATSVACRVTRVRLV